MSAPCIDHGVQSGGLPPSADVLEVILWSILYASQPVCMRRVTTSSQKVLDKLVRKDRRRAERAGADADLEWLLVNGFEALLEATLEAESAARGLKLSGGTCAATGLCIRFLPTSSVKTAPQNNMTARLSGIPHVTRLIGIAVVKTGVEFKLGDGNSGLRIHGALPKGTNRKYERIAPNPSVLWSMVRAYTCYE